MTSKKTISMIIQVNEGALNKLMQTAKPKVYSLYVDFIHRASLMEVTKKLKPIKAEVEKE